MRLRQHRQNQSLEENRANTRTARAGPAGATKRMGAQPEAATLAIKRRSPKTKTQRNERRSRPRQQGGGRLAARPAPETAKLSYTERNRGGGRSREEESKFKVNYGPACAPSDTHARAPPLPWRDAHRPCVAHTPCTPARRAMVHDRYTAPERTAASRSRQRST